MKNRRLLPLGLGLVALVALGATGCFITSGRSSRTTRCRTRSRSTAPTATSASPWT